MKPLYLTTQDIHQRASADAVARAVGVSVRSVYQWAESPDESGKVSPIQRFSDWANYVTSLHDPEINKAVLEILKPLLDNMELAVFSSKTITQLRRLVAEVSPCDERLNESKATTICPSCDDPLEYVPVAGGWYCRTCGGK